MLTITDSGCREHQSCQVTFNGSQATLINELIVNLPMNGSSYTYICAFGHTHQVFRHFPDSQVVPVLNCGRLS